MQHEFYITTECVHNWTTRYADSPYYADLPAATRRAIEHANRQQWQTGAPSVGELARDLAAQFPELVYS